MAKEGLDLRKPQIKVLEVLSKAKSALTRNAISEKAGCRVHMLSAYLGSNDREKREANDKKHYPSLLSLGFVKAEISEGMEGTTYTITPKGLKALGKTSA